MPAFDGTGPAGQGARTGGGFGYCPPVGERENRGNIIYGVGRGGIPRAGGRGFVFGGGRATWQGRGRGARGGRFGRFVQAPIVNEIPADQEITLLREQSSALQNELAQIQARLDALTQNPEA